MNLPSNQFLREILSSGEVRHPSGKIYRLTSATSAEEASVMYDFLCNQKPTMVIEIGMAYGVSALTILSALQENGVGKLVSIDPYPKWESARQTALNYIELSGFSALHEHIHAPSEFVLPELASNGFSADFVYIDGHHGFDHAFLDFFYADKLLNSGGVMAFDDSAWRSVHKVIKYQSSHRDYIELNVGLKRRYKGRNIIGTGVKIIQKRYGSSRYFQKNSEWEPPYNFYKRF